MTQVYGSCSVTLISSRLLLFFIDVHLIKHMLMLNMSCVFPSLTMSIGCTACVLFLSLLRLASRYSHQQLCDNCTTSCVCACRCPSY